jgi:hypothetical protein
VYHGQEENVSHLPGWEPTYQYDPAWWDRAVRRREGLEVQGGRNIADMSLQQIRQGHLYPFSPPPMTLRMDPDAALRDIPAPPVVYPPDPPGRKMVIEGGEPGGASDGEEQAGTPAPLRRRIDFG